MAKKHYNILLGRNLFKKLVNILMHLDFIHQADAKFINVNQKCHKLPAKPFHSQTTLLGWTIFSFNSYSLLLFFFSACCLLYKHHSHSLISMAAERTCKSIWLIIFTLPAEAGLSWGYLHLSLLSFFVHFNSSSYYPSNHIFTLTIALCVYAYVYTRIYIYTPLGRQ